MLKGKIVLSCSLILLLTISLRAQSGNEMQLTGNLNIDSYQLSKDYSNKKINLSLPSSDKKSPMLGGLMSLILPGAGEVYAGDYLKAAVFAAVEAAVITVALVYDGKGDTQTEKFEKFANEHWSVKRYAQWTIDNLQNPGSVIYDPEFNPADYSVFNSDGSVNWNELNRLEASIGFGYSHHLPPYGHQQYYELIGKYPQYSHGWSDADLSETDYHILSPYFTYYSGERGKANDYYNVAAKAVIGIYLNHFLSALDAVWSTISYNKDIAMKVRVENLNFADHTEFVPTVNIQFHF